MCQDRLFLSLEKKKKLKWGLQKTNIRNLTKIKHDIKNIFPLKCTSKAYKCIIYLMKIFPFKEIFSFGQIKEVVKCYFL